MLKATNSNVQQVDKCSSETQTKISTSHREVETQCESDDPWNNYQPVFDGETALLASSLLVESDRNAVFETSGTRVVHGLPNKDTATSDASMSLGARYVLGRPQENWWKKTAVETCCTQTDQPQFNVASVDTQTVDYRVYSTSTVLSTSCCLQTDISLSSVDTQTERYCFSEASSYCQTDDRRSLC